MRTVAIALLAFLSAFACGDTKLDNQETAKERRESKAAEIRAKKKALETKNDEISRLVDDRDALIEDILKAGSEDKRAELEKALESVDSELEKKRAELLELRSKPESRAKPDK